MTEALIVDPVGRNTYGDLGIWLDEHVPPLARIAAFLQSQGSHPRRSAASCRAEILAPAALGGARAPRRRRGRAGASRPGSRSAAAPRRSVAGWQQPRAMTIDEIKRLVDAYGAGARRAAQAGFEVLDIHAAHGYLIHSFLSPVANHAQRRLWRRPRRPHAHRARDRRERARRMAGRPSRCSSACPASIGGPTSTPAPMAGRSRTASCCPARCATAASI